MKPVDIFESYISSSSNSCLRLKKPLYQVLEGPSSGLKIFIFTGQKGLGFEKESLDLSDVPHYELILDDSEPKSGLESSNPGLIGLSGSQTSNILFSSGQYTQIELRKLKYHAFQGKTYKKGRTCSNSKKYLSMKECQILCFLRKIQGGLRFSGQKIELVPLSNRKIDVFNDFWVKN